MSAVGILYLLVDESLLQQPKPVVKDKTQQISWPIARTVIGAQVWLRTMNFGLYVV